MKTKLVYECDNSDGKCFPSTKDSKRCGRHLEKLKLIQSWEDRFDKLFVHKGEDGDDSPEEWSWTIMGSFPIEVKAFIRSILEEKK